MFDSSAEFDGVSLNKELLSGPDLANNLHGILIRFRQHNVTVTCDIQHMFYCFYVHPEHRSLWFKDNNPKKEIIEYEMTMHTFGNTYSPAVANFCLRRTAEDGEEIFGSAAKEFVTSTPLDTDTTSLVKNTQALLATTYIQLQGGFELHCCHGFPRCYHPNNFGQITCVELHAFSDASEDAIIGVTVYLKLVDKEERVSVSLILAQTKLALR